MLDLNKDAPDVVTEAKFRQLVVDGFDVEIVSRADAYSKTSFWHGEWIVWANSPDGNSRKLLVTFGRTGPELGEIRFRVFKTINGLVSFMRKMGFEDVHIPLVEGGRAVQRRPEGD